MLLQFSQFLPLYVPSTLHPPMHQHFPISSCPWVVHTSSLSSLFPKPFLPLPIYFMPTNFASSSLYLFLPIPPIPLSTENPLCDVHFSDSVPVLVVCLVFVFVDFLFLLGSFVDSCEFVVILLFIFFIFFFLYKSL